MMHYNLGLSSVKLPLLRYYRHLSFPLHKHQINSFNYEALQGTLYPTQLRGEMYHWLQAVITAWGQLCPPDELRNNQKLLVQSWKEKQLRLYELDLAEGLVHTHTLTHTPDSTESCLNASCPPVPQMNGSLLSGWYFHMLFAPLDDHLTVIT